MQPVAARHGVAVARHGAGAEDLPIGAAAPRGGISADLAVAVTLGAAAREATGNEASISRFCR